MEDKTVKVPSISCGHCVSTIEREVGGLDGVESVSAEQRTKHVTVSWDPEVTDWVVIENHMREISYGPAD